MPGLASPMAFEVKCAQKRDPIYRAQVFGRNDPLPHVFEEKRHPHSHQQANSQRNTHDHDLGRIRGFNR